MDKMDQQALNYSGEIWVTHFNAEAADLFREQVLQKAKEGPDIPITIRINSYGGFVDSLAKMLETMDEVPNKFITIASGCAMSCGAILLSHGDMRFCGPYSRVMIHNVSSGSWGDAYSLKADSEETHRLNKLFMGLLAENCDLTYGQLQNKIKESLGSKEIWLNAEDAKKFGIVDMVGIPRILPQLSWGFSIEEKEKPEPKTKRKTSSKKTSSKKTSNKKR